MKQQTSAASETYTKGRNIIDFTGKTIYVGIDVHQKDYQVAKVYNGICLVNHRMSSGADGLIEHACILRVAQTKIPANAGGET
jgi:transposase